MQLSKIGAEQVEATAASSSGLGDAKPKHKLEVKVPEWCGKWVVSMDAFKDGVVGAKSKNIAGQQLLPAAFSHSPRTEWSKLPHRSSSQKCSPALVHHQGHGQLLGISTSHGPLPAVNVNALNEGLVGRCNKCLGHCSCSQVQR